MGFKKSQGGEELQKVVPWAWCRASRVLGWQVRKLGLCPPTTTGRPRPNLPEDYTSKGSAGLPVSERDSSEL